MGLPSLPWHLARWTSIKRTNRTEFQALSEKGAALSATAIASTAVTGACLVALDAETVGLAALLPCVGLGGLAGWATNTIAHNLLDPRQVVFGRMAGSILNPTSGSQSGGGGK